MSIDIMELMKKMADDNSATTSENEKVEQKASEVKQNAETIENTSDELVKDIETMIDELTNEENSKSTTSEAETENSEDVKISQALENMLNKILADTKDQNSRKLASAIINDSLKPEYLKIAKEVYNSTFQRLLAKEQMEKQAALMNALRGFPPYFGM